jgi:hypothetical protein
MLKSCKNELIVAKFLFAIIFRFREIFAKSFEKTKIFAKTKNIINLILLNSITFWEDKKNICAVMLELSCR